MLFISFLSMLQALGMGKDLIPRRLFMEPIRINSQAMLSWIGSEQLLFILW